MMKHHSHLEEFRRENGAFVPSATPNDFMNVTRARGGGKSQFSVSCTHYFRHLFQIPCSAFEDTIKTRATTHVLHSHCWHIAASTGSGSIKWHARVYICTNITRIGYRKYIDLDTDTHKSWNLR